MMENKRGEIFFPILFAAIHRTMVALKYASLSSSEYRFVVRNIVLVDIFNSIYQTCNEL